MRVLLVEDDNDLADVLRRGLCQAHMAVDWAPTAFQAIEHLLINNYDIVCLDLGLPDRDGINLCEQIRSDNSLQKVHGVIILTARTAVAERVRGLDSGADDYLVKPFAFSELLARIRALSRRYDQHPTIIKIQDLSIDLSNFKVWKSNEELILTSREYSVLRYLATHSSKVVSSEELVEHCWDFNADPLSNSVRVILSRLRRKLGTAEYIKTIPGMGYRLDNI